MNNIENTLPLLLDKLISYTETGLGLINSAEQLSEYYVLKYPNIDEAIVALIKNESKKAASSGFITGIGSILLFPVSLPTNLIGSLFIQIRLAACIGILRQNSISDPTFKIKLISSLLAKKGILSKTRLVPVKTMFSSYEKNAYDFVLTKLMSKIKSYLIAQGSKKMIKFIPLLGAIVASGMEWSDARTTGYNANYLFKNS